MVITVIVVGPFEEEEEGTGIASDLVTVQGEDPATPGLLPKGIDPGTVTIPQYRVNKTKQHTHTLPKELTGNGNGNGNSRGMANMQRFLDHSQMSFPEWQSE